MAAWNCGFLGARGGMYERSRSGFRSDLSAIRAGRPVGRRQRSLPGAEAPMPTCPACVGRSG
jgi:fructokinase